MSVSGEGAWEEERALDQAASSSPHFSQSSSWLTFMYGPHEAVEKLDSSLKRDGNKKK